MRGMNGGYKVINFKDTNLTVSQVEIKGLYESIENSYRKALLLTNLVINAVEKNDVFAEPNVVGANYEFKVYGGTIEVTKADMVKYTAAA